MALKEIQTNDFDKPVSFDAVAYGLREWEPESTEIVLPFQEDEKLSIGAWNTPTNLIRRARNIRNAVEWVAWTDQTLFPDDKPLFMPGEAQGQCMVTARFAKPYFPGSLITEVQVKREDDRLAGPHIVLNLNDDSGKPIYLDFSPDQEDAAGSIAYPIKAANPLRKIAICDVDSPECPYVFSRYQSDEQLATKKSKPLEHTRLLWEMMAYRYEQPNPHRIQRFMTEVQPPDREQLTSGHPKILSRLFSVSPNLTGNQQIQVGVVGKDEFLPDPDWLWKATGLSGHSYAVVEHQGYIKQVLTFNGEQIVQANLRGSFTHEELTVINNKILPDPTEAEVLFYQNMLEPQIYSSGFTGPIFVDKNS